MEPNKPLMPIVSFEKKSVEDRTQSIEKGRRVMRDVDYITFIPHGSGGKTKVEYVFDEWKERIQNEVNQGDEYNPSRFPREWYDRIVDGYGKWQKGEEIPVEGTALKNWPAISPAEYENCKANEIHTVEQLAQANDHTVSMLGMGGRNLVDRAKNTVRMSNDGEATAARLTALETSHKALLEENAILRANALLAASNQNLGIDAQQGGGVPMQVGVAATGAAKALPNVIDGKKPNGDDADGDSGSPANNPGTDVDTTKKTK